MNTIDRKTTLNAASRNDSGAAPTCRHSRPEVVLSALLHLLTAYARRPCPHIANCIAAHCTCLAQHPGVDTIIRQICCSMSFDWRTKALGPSAPSQPLAH